MTRTETTKETEQQIPSNIQMWPEEKIERFRETLLSWYDTEKRDLPWRRNNDPYRIWVSEIMLQQTRVDTVIPYYLNFMKTFPSIQELAEADEDELLKAWEGLGYYSRVRNMQKAAIQIMENHDGKMPQDPKEIAQLKGIGPYTTGAIASMAFGLPEPAVDGNVMRVLSRLFEIDADLAKPASRKVYEAVMRKVIDPNRPGDFNQAFMDLGATICTPTNYHPDRSPVKEFNQSYQNGSWMNYPIKSKKAKAKPVYYAGVAVKNAKGEFLLERRPSEGLLANMWIFPLIEEEGLLYGTTLKNGERIKTVSNEDNEQVLKNLSDELFSKYGVQPVLMKKPFDEVTHIFSHLKWFVSVFYGLVPEGKERNIPESCHWVHPDDFSRYSFPKTQSKMWESYQKKFQSGGIQGNLFVE